MKEWKRIGALLLAACMLFSLTACFRSGGEETTDGATAGTSDTQAPTQAADAPAQPTTGSYTVTLTSQLGNAFEGVGIYVYEDATKQELVWFARTDASGTVSFTAKVQEGYVAYLDNPPAGYAVAEGYPLTGESTAIVLEVEMASEIEGKTFALGAVMWDLSVTDVQGNTWQLSQLLREKDAVLLNFWFMECAPCRMEFPDLQKAYESRGESLAVLALNPIDGDEAAIAQFAVDMGLTFPVAKCGQEVANALKVSAYPTTVIIDRNGIISLIHQGGITGAGAFGDVMDHFTAEDYVPGPVEDVNTIITPEDNEPEEIINNPTEISGVTSAELTVRGGETVYVDLYRMFDMYLQIKSPNAKLSYSGKTYTPKNGTIGLVVRTPDSRTPVTIGLTNTGTETETYKLTFSALAGSLNNPYKMKLGEFEVSISAGKEEGIYYRYTAEADGWLTLCCLSASKGTPYGYTLYNLNTYANRTLEGDSVLDEDGKVVVRIQVHKGDRVQFCASALPNDSGSYPAIEMTFLASFREGLEEVDPDAGKIIYAVTVTDENRQPIPGVSVQIVGEKGTENLTTDEKGAAALKLLPGNYQAKVRLPEGYTATTTTLTLTEKYPIQSLKLEKIKVIEKKTYTVTVVDETGSALADVLVSLGDSFTFTDAAGSASFTLDEGSYSAIVEVPEGYTSDAFVFAFEEGKTELTVVLNKEVPPETEPEETEPEETKPQETEPEETKPQETEPEETEPQETEPQETEPEETQPAELTYTVKVTDFPGNPMTGVTVTIRQDGNVVALKRVNASGEASAVLPTGSYTVSLAFPAGTSYYYDEATAVLTPEAPAVTVVAVGKQGDTVTELYVGNAVHVEAGATYVSGMQADVTNYFIYLPTESGMFRFTTSKPDAQISYWGANTNYITNQTGLTDYEQNGDNSFTLEIREEYVENAVYILGITGAADAVIQITRVGDVILTDEEKAEWILYEAKEPAEAFDLTLPADKQLTWLDLTAESILYVKGSDGYYHLNSEDGPILYMNLGTDGRYLSMYSMLGFEQAGGTGLKATFYDENGKFLRKEDYTNCMQSFIIACTDSSGYGVYPLNDDLIYMIQSAGNTIGWYDSEDPSYLFYNSKNVNPEIAWMFLVCYVA